MNFMVSYNILINKILISLLTHLLHPIMEESFKKSLSISIKSLKNKTLKN